MAIDFHTHIFPPWLKERRQLYIERDTTFAELYKNPEAKIATAEDLLIEMEEDGIEMSVVMGIGWTDHGLAREVNDYIIDSTRKYPRQLFGFAGINPALGKKAAAEVERCAKAGLRGVGELHPHCQSYDLGNYQTMAPILDVIRHHNMIVCTHSSEPVGHLYPGKGTTTPDVLLRFIRNASDINIVCAHWGGGLPFYYLMPEVSKVMDNVYFDTAASPFLYKKDIFPLMTKLIGANKILLGSDFPLLRAKRLINQIEKSELSEDDRMSITTTNAMNLIGIDRFTTQM